MTILAEPFLLQKKTRQTAYVRHSSKAPGQDAWRHQLREASIIPGVEAASRDKKGNRS